LTEILGGAAAPIHTRVIDPIVPTCRVAVVPRVEVSLVVDTSPYCGAGIAQVEEVVMVNKNAPLK